MKIMNWLQKCISLQTQPRSQCPLCSFYRAYRSRTYATTGIQRTQKHHQPAGFSGSIGIKVKFKFVNRIKYTV